MDHCQWSAVNHPKKTHAFFRDATAIAGPNLFKILPNWVFLILNGPKVRNGPIFYQKYF